MNKMLLLFVLAAFLCIAGCSSTASFTAITEQEKSLLIETNPPTVKQYQELSVYLTSIVKRKIANQPALLVKGELPNGCARLADVSYSYSIDERGTDGKTLVIQLSAWKKQGEVCSQQLVPFTYPIENLSTQEISSIEQYSYNNEIHPVN